MSTNLYWYHNDSVIFIQSTDRLTLPETLEADVLLLKMMNNSQSQCIHFIYDTRNLVALPSITNMRNIRYINHPRLQFSVIIGMNSGLTSVMRVLMLIFRSKFRGRVYFAKTVEEGIVWLINQLPELSDMSYRDIETLSPYAQINIAG